MSGTSDILNLLARSTNLQKSLQNAEKYSKKQIPSAGGSTHVPSASVYDHSVPRAVDLNDPPYLAKGIKRKRKGPDEHQTPAGHSPTEFFKQHDVANEIQAVEAARESVAEDVSHSTVDDSQSTTLLDEKECRRVLKSHKLKVTLLNLPDEALVQDKEQSGRRTTSSFKSPN